MSSSSIESSTLDSLIAGYEPRQTETNANDEMGSEKFLTLLVAQLENQNPMDPADSDQFTDQLAQFTQVEQLINLNDKMDEMTTGMAETRIGPSIGRHGIPRVSIRSTRFSSTTASGRSTAATPTGV